MIPNPLRRIRRARQHVLWGLLGLGVCGMRNTLMPDYQAASGPVDVVASGIVTSFRGSPIEIVFSPLTAPLALASSGGELPPDQNQPQKKGRLKVIFSFVDEHVSDPAQPPSPRADAALDEHEPLAVRLSLFNFNNPLGSGSERPLQFAHAYGRTLYLQYRVFQAGVEKTLQFTIYQSQSSDQQVSDRPAGDGGRRDNDGG